MENHNVPGLPPEAREVRGDGRFYGWLAAGMGGCTRIWWYGPDRGLRSTVLAPGLDGRKRLVAIRADFEAAGLVLPPEASPDPSAPKGPPPSEEGPDAEEIRAKIEKLRASGRAFLALADAFERTLL